MSVPNKRSRFLAPDTCVPACQNEENHFTQPNSFTDVNVDQVNIVGVAAA